LKEQKRNIDILCVGEALIDFIGHQKGASLDKARDYQRHLGGSPTNVAVNASRLGLRSALAATLGSDEFGDFILKRLTEEGVMTAFLRRIENEPTSVVFVSRSDGTPDFIAFRQADSQIVEEQISKETLLDTKVFHTTCFALSRTPSQVTIMKKAREAFELGCKLSIDLNYSKKIWDDENHALVKVNEYCKFNPLIKISADDVRRLFNGPMSDGEVFEHFHSEGAEIVCLTVGSKGVKLSQKGEKLIQSPAVQVDVVMDATGAGDAFWSGFLYAYIHKKPLEKCVSVGQQLAALKLQNVGRLPENIKLVSQLM
jgi:fructokinase